MSDFRPQPKKRTPRDADYLKWIKTLPCVFCGAEPAGDSHHTDTGGTSLVGSDYSAIPADRLCHSNEHSTNGKKHRWKADELAALTSRLLSEYQEINRDNAKALQRVEDQLKGAW